MRFRLFIFSILLVGCAAAPSIKPLSADGTDSVPGVSRVKPQESAAPRTPQQTSAAHASREALYQRACDLGSAIACNDLAILLEKDASRAVPLLEKSCNMGLDRGCTNLGAVISSDVNELGRARKLFEKSCSRSDPLACAMLADLAYVGRGMARDLTEAGRAYAKACELGHSESCVSSGWMLDGGEGTAKDPTRAVELFRLACTRKSYSGCAALGYKLTQAPTNREEFEQGMHWMGVACDKQEASGCFLLGVRFTNVKGGMNPEARQLFTRACKLGHSRACEFAALPDRQVADATETHSDHDDESDEAEEESDE
jgi:TPR repeat protein